MQCTEMSQRAVHRSQQLLRVAVRTYTLACDCRYQVLQNLTKKELPLYYDTAVHSGEKTEPCTHTGVKDSSRKSKLTLFMCCMILLQHVAARRLESTIRLKR
jgi:hypothetical protein